MPSATSKITVIPLHETFCAEVLGVDFSQPITADVKDAIQAAIDKYGVLIFRKTGLLQTDDADDKHAAFAALFGELDDMSVHLKVGRKLRLKNVQMFDVSNLDSDGNLVTENDPARLNMMKGNNLWHADLAFNSRRSGYSILRGAKLPPKGTGGDTEFLDARTAYDDLPEETKAKINNLVGNNSMWHNRKLAAPEYYADVNPRDYPFAKHKLVTNHANTGRKFLYATSYIHHIDGMSDEESQALVDELLAFASQPKYVKRIHWENDGDMVMWDNTAVMHRATEGGSYLTKYPRDVRRTTSFDMGPEAHGLNDPNKPFRQGLNPAQVKLVAEPAAAEVMA